METPPPGQVVSPQGPSNPESATPPEQPQQAPEPQTTPESQTISTGLYSDPTLATPGFTQPDAFAQPATVENTTNDDIISWTASEYIAHHKSSNWYLLLGLAGAALAALTYFLTDGDIVSVAVMVLVVVVFGFYGARKPREQQYAIGPDGIMIGPRVYQFSQFKSFSVVDEDAFSSITFMPMQRFMPAISIYYDPQDEDAIAEVLTAYLPVDNHGHDPVERFMRKIRF